MPAKKPASSALAKEPRQEEKQATESALMQDLFDTSKAEEPSAASTPVAVKGKGPGPSKSAKKPLSTNAKPVNTLQAEVAQQGTSAVTAQDVGVIAQDTDQPSRKKMRVLVDNEDDFQAWLDQEKADAVKKARKLDRDQALKDKREKEAMEAAAKQQAALKQQRIVELDRMINKAQQEKYNISHQAVIGGVVHEEEIPLEEEPSIQQSLDREDIDPDREDRIRDFKIRSLEAQLRKEKSRQSMDSQFMDASESEEPTNDEEMEEGEISDPTQFNFAKKNVTMDLAKHSWSLWTSREIKEDRKRLKAQLDRVLKQGSSNERVMAEISGLAQETMHTTIQTMNTLNMAMQGGTRTNKQAFAEAMNEADSIVQSKLVNFDYLEQK